MKLRILLSDLCAELGATIMGICDESGKGIVGADIEIDTHEGIKESLCEYCFNIKTTTNKIGNNDIKKLVRRFNNIEK